MTMTACCRRVRSELSRTYPFYSLDEQDGNILDVKATFAPGAVDGGRQTPRGWGLLVLRLAMIAWIAGPGIALSIYKESQDGPGVQRYWPIYFTSLTALLTLAYFLCAGGLLLVALVGKGGACLSQPVPPHPTSALVRLVWTLYSIGAPCNLIVVLNYWALVFDPAGGSTASVDTITLHGISCVLMLIDGNAVAHIPIRAKHAVLGLGYMCALTLWSVIHSFSNIGNGDRAGEDEDPFNEDDQLYSALDWKHDPKKAAINTALTFFVVFPVCFAVAYSLSVWSCCPCGCGGSGRHWLPAQFEAESVDGDQSKEENYHRLAGEDKPPASGGMRMAIKDDTRVK